MENSNRSWVSSRRTGISIAVLSVTLLSACERSRSGPAELMAPDMMAPNMQVVVSNGVSFTVGSFAYKTDGSIIVPGGLSFKAFTDTSVISGDTVVFNQYYCTLATLNEEKFCAMSPGGKEKAGIIDGFVVGGPRLFKSFPINSVDMVTVTNFPRNKRVFLAASADSKCTILRWTRDTPWNGPVVAYGARLTIYPAPGETYYAIAECKSRRTTKPGQGDDPTCIVCGASFESAAVTPPSAPRIALDRSPHLETFTPVAENVAGLAAMS